MVLYHSEILMIGIPKKSVLPLREFQKKGDCMHYVNETVLYGTYGVCRIADIEERDFTGSPKTYYVLKPVKDEKSTIYVCVHNEKAVRQMRQVMSADEIHELIRNMPEETAEWIENKNERNEKYKAILNSGDRHALVRMVRSLYLHRQRQKELGKKMHITDEKFFKDAEKMLYDEFAAALNIRQEQVLPYIMGQLDGKKT